MAIKILTINCVDKLYSTGRIIRSIEKYTKENECEFFHCFEEGEANCGENEYLISNYLEHRWYILWAKITGMQYGVGTWPTQRLCNQIKRYQPDIVHIHCPNARSVNLYYLLTYLKTHNQKTIITNHAEFFFTGNCSHAFECTGYLHGCKDCYDYKKQTDSWLFNRTEEAWKKMKDALNDFESLYMVAVSSWSEERIKTSIIAKGIPVLTIQNGIDTKAYFYKRENKSLEGKYKGKRILLHVTSNFSDELNDPKGGRYVIEIAKAMPEFQVIIVGPYHLSGRKIPSNMELLGVITNPIHLAEYYSLADLLVMTSKRETFGMTCAESLSCGTPVVGFRNGGSETIALKEYSEFVQYGNTAELIEVIKKWIVRKESVSEQLEKIAGRIYSEQYMAEKYLELYRNILKRENSNENRDCYFS